MGGDWERFEPRAPFLPEDQGKPYFWGSSLDFEDWLRENKPHLLFPERETVPLDGAIGWTPAHEDRAAALCPVCLSGFAAPPLCLAPAVRSAAMTCSKLAHKIDPLEHDEQGQPLPRRADVISPFGWGSCPLCRGISMGSQLYCPKCGGSGHDHKARQQLQLAGLPPAERTKPPKWADEEEPEYVAASSPATGVPVSERLTRREQRARKFKRAQAAGEESDGRTNEG